MRIRHSTTAQSHPPCNLCIVSKAQGTYLRTCHEAANPANACDSSDANFTNKIFPDVVKGAGKESPQNRPIRGAFSLLPSRTLNNNNNGATYNYYTFYIFFLIVSKDFCSFL